MSNMVASVLARLKNKAKERDRSHQLCLQLFCQEEFLRRLEKSKYAENLVTETGKFSYAQYVAFGRELDTHIDREFLINLPVTGDVTPDWDWMDDYMKSLPYSDRI